MPVLRSRYLDAGRLASARRSVRPKAPRTFALRLKYALDRIAAVCAFALTVPLTAVVALALLIRGGPVLARETQLGEAGREIVVLTFAITVAMRRGRPWRALDRAGVTFLPQLLNVVRGDLSLIGPRPRPLDHTPPPARPGLTGLAQVERLRRPITLADRLDLDAEYAQFWSLAADARIAARTLLSFVKR